MMTDAELVARLRDCSSDEAMWSRQAADRIEALKAHYEVLWETNLRIGIERDTFKASIEELTIELNEVRKEWEGWQSAAVKLMEKFTAVSAERDKAYASGYSDAETEISKSALGQRVAFLNAEYANAAARIKALTADFARQVHRTDEQRESYEQALSVMEAERDEALADGRKFECAWMTAEGLLDVFLSVRY